MPVVEYYERKRKLAKISAVPPPDEVSVAISPSISLLSVSQLQRLQCCGCRHAYQSDHINGTHLTLLIRWSQACVKSVLLQER